MWKYIKIREKEVVIIEKSTERQRTRQKQNMYIGYVLIQIKRPYPERFNVNGNEKWMGNKVGNAVLSNGQKVQQKKWHLWLFNAHFTRTNFTSFATIQFTPDTMIWPNEKIEMCLTVWCIAHSKWNYAHTHQMPNHQFTVEFVWQSFGIRPYQIMCLLL